MKFILITNNFLFLGKSGLHCFFTFFKLDFVQLHIRICYIYNFENAPQKKAYQLENLNLNCKSTVTQPSLKQIRLNQIFTGGRLGDLHLFCPSTPSHLL